LPTLSLGNHYDPGITGTDVWLTHGLNSLSMDWTGKGGTVNAATRSGVWESGDLFYSFQHEGPRHETHFLSGDKVYISGTGKIDVDLMPTSETTGSRIIVSGLVVGQSAAQRGTEEFTPGGEYTIGDSGGPSGITANAKNAFGQYVGESYDMAGEQDKATGKLEKFGDSTLIFANTGVNNFTGGIDLSGGVTRFSNSGQLGDGSYNEKELVPNAYGTHFLKDATLEAGAADTTLFNSVTIEDGVTGTFSAGAGKSLFYDGELRGGTSDAVLNKSGGGLVELRGELEPDSGKASKFDGRMTVNDGTLRVTGTYKLADAEVYGNNGKGILSGTGWLKTATVENGGTLKPAGLDDKNIEHPLNTVGALTFKSGGNFNVRIAKDNGTPKSDFVNADGTVTIEKGATLEVDHNFNYWSEAFTFSDVYRIIDAKGGEVADPAAQFDLRPLIYMPRGVTLDHAWNLTGNDPRLYQLMIRYNPDNGFGDIPGNTPNQNEVGDSIDDIIEDRDPGLSDIIDRISDPEWSDREVGNLLDQLSGDLTANALYMAFKEPWRHPFNRLTAAIAEPPTSPATTDSAVPGSGPSRVPGT
jgi:hypothetical protein